MHLRVLFFLYKVVFVCYDKNMMKEISSDEPRGSGL